MSLFQCSFFSKTLCTMTNVLVCLPSLKSNQALATPLEELYKRDDYKVLILLHGMFEDETIWLRRSNIERYATEEKVAVVMPCGGNNYYLNMEHGLPYFTYLTEELPLFIKSSFALNLDRDNVTIAGLSMGGYGACLAAFTRPDLYGSFASLSGAVDIELLSAKAKEQGMGKLLENIFGTHPVKNSHGDLFYLVKNLVHQNIELPKGYISCGTEDTECYLMNQNLKKILEELQYPFVFHQEKGGHEWDLWDREIRKVLRWMKEI